MRLKKLTRFVITTAHTSNNILAYFRILQKEKCNKVLETSGFCKFLNDEQKEPDVDINSARTLVREHETVLSACKLTTIGINKINQL
jgi:hypothetical protein